MWRRFISHPLQAAVAALAWGLFAILPVAAASWLGGWIARALGPRLGVSRTARRNLGRVMPELTAENIENIVTGMWDNLGRTAAEHPHLKRFAPTPENPRVELIGGEYIDQLRDDGRPGIFFSAHFANWELGGIAVATRGIPPHMIYRAANNPWIDRMISAGRGAMGGSLVPKGAQGARQALAALRDNEHLTMVVDQKMNDGISVPFMGIEAMTAPALAQFALRYDCPIVPIQVERLGGINFRITIHPPVRIPTTEDRHAATMELMTTVNEIIGDWIRARPEQWLWVHNRWPAAEK